MGPHNFAGVRRVRCPGVKPRGGLGFSAAPAGRRASPLRRVRGCETTTPRTGQGRQRHRDYFEGALVDASLRAGFKVPRAGDVFVDVRYVGGGARGTDSTLRGGTDGYAETGCTRWR